MKIDETNFNLIKRSEELTNEEYDIYWKDAENIDGYIDADEICRLIENLICEIDHKEEELEDLKEDIRSNYVQVPIGTQVDISDKDFI